MSGLCSRPTAPGEKRLHLVAFDLLELAGDDIRPLPWTSGRSCCAKRSPLGDRLRLSRPGQRAAPRTDQLVALGFEGSVLKRPASMYRPGRQATWRKYKASHRATATLKRAAAGRDGHTYAISDLDGRQVTTLASPRLAAMIGRQVELAYSRVDATVRCARCGSARSTSPRIDIRLGQRRPGDPPIIHSSLPATKPARLRTAEAHYATSCFHRPTSRISSAASDLLSAGSRSRAPW